MAKETISANQFYVYILFRPETGEPFYVGKGCGDRWMRHELDRRSETNKHKQSIIRAAKLAGYDIPKVKFASDLTEDEAFQVERLLISVIGRRSLGGPLCNLTDGGDGVAGFKFTQEGREKLSRAKKGRKLPEAHRLNLVEAAARPEVKLKQSISQKLRLLDPQARINAGIKNRGKKRTAECAAKQKANNPGHTGHKHTDEAKAKMSAAFKGKPWTEARRTAQLAKINVLT